MRVAFIDNLPVGGGLSRFSLLLCRSIIDYNPSVSVDYFIHHANLKQIPELAAIQKRLNVCVLKTTVPKGRLDNIARKVSAKLFMAQVSNRDENEVFDEIGKRVTRQYDLAYFPSAHMMKRPELDVPVVGTLHDFNWKYFFGREIFPIPFVEMMDKEILKWMEQGWNACSSQDVVDEARKLYPSAKRYPEVVHIAPVVVHKDIGEERAAAILRELKIDFPYIIFPGNFYPHKNHLNLFTAFSLLRKRKGFESYKLILTGMNSEQVPKGVAEYRGVRILTKNSAEKSFDVMGMGYQPNEVIDALIANARLLVSPSIYEAICTPAMDAWHFGTPTAISDIPPFREHEKAWGIRSAFFDPMDPENIADTLENYLNRYDQAKTDGKISKDNMAKYTWKQVSEGYMNIFRKAIEKQ